MPSSAFEDYVREMRTKLILWVKDQDRFVLIGLVFSIIPIPPSFLIGLFIGFVNIFLVFAGKLERKYLNLILFAVFLSIFNLLLTGYVYFAIYKTFWMLDIFRVGMIGFFQNYFALFGNIFLSLFDLVRRFFFGDNGITQTV